MHPVCPGHPVPLAVSTISTLTDSLPITATPISFIPTILLSGIAIYRFHMLDIKPIATQHVLDWISDCYLVISDTGLVISYNRPFANVFASQFGIAENQYLRSCVKQEDVANKTAVYYLMTGLESWPPVPLQYFIRASPDHPRKRRCSKKLLSGGHIPSDCAG